MYFRENMARHKRGVEAEGFHPWFLTSLRPPEASEGGGREGVGALSRLVNFGNS